MEEQEKPAESEGRKPITEPDPVRGTRRLAREKVMQILFAEEMSGGNWKDLFNNVFHYDFRDEERDASDDRLLTRKEIELLELDAPINWQQDEKLFAMRMLNTVHDSREEIETLIKEFSHNWEYDRLALIDRIIMIMAINELQHFFEVPSRVTINEAIEIAKKYSTEKSGVFINGILDTALTHFKKTGLREK